MSALAGIVIGFLVRKATPWIAGVKDEKGIRWPWPEAVGALLFGFAGWRIEVLAFSTLLLAVLTADFRYKLIPDKVTYPGTAIGVLASIFWPEFITAHFEQHVLLKTIGASGGFPLALAGAGIGFVVFEGFRRIMSRIASMEVMGMGDSKLVMMMGAFLGPWGVLLALFPGMVCGLVIGVVYTRIMRSPHFPFGPALGLGGYITMLWPSLIGDGIGWLQDLGRRSDRGVLIVVNILLLLVATWLMLRVRKRSKEYTDAIEEDYSKLEDREKK
ncbi:MAG: prepilin peptidase [Planctomycetota bacterium]|jgi:prepilin signal peptidase PulO-like enzyme (type II secretory pathway)